MKEQEIIAKLKEDGYEPVYVWDAKPGEEDEEHIHDFDTKLVILEGDIRIKVASDGITDYKLKKGDTLDINKRQIHSAVVGGDGCRYVVAEKH